MRTLVIGDIHGNIRALREALNLANYQPEKDRIVCVGDYIDGWGDPVDVVDLLISLQERSPFQNIYLLGNHDAWLLESMEEGIDLFRDRSYVESKYFNWISQGGDLTYHTYCKLTDEDWKRYKLDFFKKLRPYFLENNKLFVHAGFDPSIGWERTLKSDPNAILSNRTLFEQAYHLWISKEHVND